MLDSRHPPDPADDEGAVGHAEETAQRSTVGLVGGDSPVEVDPEPDHVELLRRCDSSSTRSSRTSGLTATRRVVTRARLRSTSLNTAARTGSK